jgi:hypothetical protein
MQFNQQTFERNRLRRIAEVQAEAARKVIGYTGFSRRKLLYGAGVMALTAMLPKPVVAQQRFSSFAGVLSALDPKYTALGVNPNNTGDSTAGLQALANDCFGTSANPNSSTGALNRVMLIPPGNYLISSAILLSKLRGGRVIGGGRPSNGTQITNTTASGNVFTTNGCGFSHFEGMSLTAGSGGVGFELDWDGTGGGGAALQANTFLDMLYSATSGIGIRIGHSANMGSENLFLDNHALGCGTAGMVIGGSGNALQQTIIGGDYQTCGIGIYMNGGSAPIISGVGFQQQSTYDIYIDAQTTNNLHVSGCRTETTSTFIYNPGMPSKISACLAPNASAFYNGSGPCVIDACSFVGTITPSGPSNLTIEGCKAVSIGGSDALDWLVLKPTVLWYLPNNAQAALIRVRDVSVALSAGAYSTINDAEFYTTNGSTITRKDVMWQ